MAEVVSPLLQWLNANPEWAGVATFVISASESVAIIGTVVPGSITMTAIGTLAGAGVIPLWQTILWAILGAIVGDGISYWMGYYFKDRLRRTWPFRTNPGILETGEHFVSKYGVMSVFIGRFVGPVRALVPLVAGMLGMRPLLFTIANITSAIGWAPAYMLPGILLGAASLELPPDIALHVILVLLLIALFIILCIWVTYKLFQLIHIQTNHFQNLIWFRLKRSRYFSLTTVILKHHDNTKTHGQFSLALLFIVLSVLFLALAIYVKVTGPANIVINDIVFHLFRGLSIRSDLLNHIMIDITILGQKQIVLPLIFVIAGWLLIVKRPWAALHAMMLGILTGGSIFVLKHIFRIPRPWGIFQNIETFSMPSGHTTLSTTIYLGLTFLIASGVPRQVRWPIYTLGICLVAVISISRLYLGAHWFTDVLAGWILSGAILTFIIISYQRRKEPRVKPLGVALIALATISITYTLFHLQHFTQLQSNYAQVEWPSQEITLKDWWEKDNVIPARHVSLFGYPSQFINIEWLGNLDKIRDTLVQSGWTKPPARDLVSTLHRIADVKSTDYLPLISPQYLDKQPGLILVKFVNGEKKMLVIRLWHANRIVKAANTPLWVGIVGVVPRSYSWLFTKNPSDITIDSTLVFKDPQLIKDWQWKVLTKNISIGAGKRTVQQKVILVRQK